MKDIIIFTAINELDKAETMITELLERDLIKSGTIFPEVKLYYKWDGQMNVDDEIKIMLKLSEENYADVEDYFKTGHPYLFPEIVKFDIETGSDEFKKFLIERSKS